MIYLLRSSTSAITQELSTSITLDILKVFHQIQLILDLLIKIFNTFCFSIVFAFHSIGTSIMLGALADEDPIVTSRLGKFIAMGPVAFVTKAYFGGISVAKSIESLKLLRILRVEHLPMPSSVKYISPSHLTYH